MKDKTSLSTREDVEQGAPRKTWSVHERSPLLGLPLGGSQKKSPNFMSEGQGRVTAKSQDVPDADIKLSFNGRRGSGEESKGNFLFYVIYAVVNVIIAVPGLYGYASVIFNHPVFQPHMNALAKLVIFSSMIHQIGFLLFSSLDFAIGTVQDAGLIFLSSMANDIADIMKDEGESDEAILSTTLALLSSGTALLGLILVVMGHFKLANAVSYLPMPVVGGYLAFIGYFCCQAGVALCISKPIVTLGDWLYLVDPQYLLLAAPGLLAALLLTWLSRNAKSPSALPLAMVAIPAVFYIIIYATGYGLEGAREGGWVGDVAPPVPVSELFRLVDLSLVRWDLVGNIIWTWVGMIFVVSFASCLDVAAISMDMGEALDTNRELTTVGICNFMSGLGLGFTGSYIFSQTIFTFRTGVHSRWIGSLICVVYIAVVGSPLNLLQIAPLFFLGSTLIFIGYDLLFEWLYEIRESVLLFEYATIWGTFIAIQIVGVDAGIIVGVLFAIIENVTVTAQTTMVHRVQKRSRAIWNKEGFKILQDHGYHPTFPKIAVLEISGPVFFGSSLHVLNKLLEDVGLQDSATDAEDIQSPHTSSHLLTSERRRSFFKNPHGPTVLPRPPQFIVLDLSGVSNVDASAARACFLQFSKMCSKRGIVVVASGATPRIEFMLRSHGASYPATEGDEVRETVYNNTDVSVPRASDIIDRIILFMTVHEALEFCEGTLIHQFHDKSAESSGYRNYAGPKEHTLSSAFAQMLESDQEEREVLRQFDECRYHRELGFSAGEKVFSKEQRAEGIYVVLKGALASGTGRSDMVYRHRQQIVSGAGVVPKRGSKSNLMDSLLQQSSEPPVVATIWPAGGVLGFTDTLLERQNTYSAFATQNDTRIAKITRSDMNLLQQENPVLDALLHRVLLRASILDLSNCTCDDT